MSRKRRNEPGGPLRPRRRHKRDDTAYAPLDNTAPGSPETAPITKITAAAQDEQRLRAPPAAGQPAISVVLESSHGLTSDNPIILDSDDDANDRSANINLDTARVLPSGMGTSQTCNKISTPKPSAAIESQAEFAIRHSSTQIQTASANRRVRATAEQHRTNVGADGLAALAVHSVLPPPQGDTEELEDLTDMQNDFHIMQLTRDVCWKRNYIAMLKEDDEIMKGKETENKKRIDRYKSRIAERKEEIKEKEAQIAEYRDLIDKSKEENKQLKEQRASGAAVILQYRKTTERQERRIAGLQGNRNSTATVERKEEDVATAICGPRTTKPGIMNPPQDTNQQSAGRHHHRESPVAEPKPSTVSQPDLPPSSASTASKGQFRLTHNTVHESAKELLSKLPEKSGYGKCGCKVTCGDDCSNKSGMIACDSDTCGVPEGKCENRKRTEGEPSLKITRTGDCGYGLITTEDIKEGDHVGTYLGQIISAFEYDKRKEILLEEACRQGGGTEVSFYVMELPDGIYLDATHEGNIFRYANHSCDPNTSAFRWVKGNGQPEMRLLANRNIRKDEEITFHYDNAPFQKIIDVTSTGFTIEKSCRCYQRGYIAAFKIKGLRKVYPRPLLIKRAEAYQLLRRKHNASSRRKSELDKRLLLDLAESSLSLYADERRVAKPLVIPIILKKFRQAIATNDYDRIKGGIYTLFFTSLTRTLVKDWRFAPEAMRLYIKTAGIDKPSRQNLGILALKDITNLGKPFERIVIVDNALMNTIKPAGDVSAAIETRHQFILQRRNRVETSKSSLRLELTQRARGAHWEVATRCAIFAKNLCLQFHSLAPAKFVDFAANRTNDAYLDLRDRYLNAFTSVFAAVKIRAVYGHKYHNYLLKKEVGDRNKIQVAGKKGDTNFTHNFLESFKQPKDAPYMPLRFDLYDEVESALRNQLGRISNREWLSQYFDYLKQEPRDTSIGRFRVNYVYLLMYVFGLMHHGKTEVTLEDVRELTKEVLGDKHQHRATSEILGDLLAGSSDGPPEIRNRVWEHAAPLMLNILADDLTPDNLQYWLPCLHLILIHKDPRRSPEITNALGSFRLDMTSNAAFKESSKMQLLELIIAHSCWHF
ncbi:proteasome activator subunit 4 [Fusarium albosuccineum]|uniref:Proteasome activator subunit 4 n=1 Tax=Fusarium albosuccineum TaxID=1237068 RepID=A0A8H4LCA3_9HYPO|nr:proteasome activator subunit 4 [Fusarium albosuccineum]